MQKLSIILIVILVLLNFQSILGKFSVRNHKGIDPTHRKAVGNGCYQGQCWAYCGSGKQWCWSNTSSSGKIRYCRVDGCCNGATKCVSGCGY